MPFEPVHRNGEGDGFVIVERLAVDIVFDPHGTDIGNECVCLSVCDVENVFAELFFRHEKHAERNNLAFTLGEGCAEAERLGNGIDLCTKRFNASYFLGRKRIEPVGQ